MLKIIMSSVIAAVIFAVVGVFVGYKCRVGKNSKTIAEAETEATQIINDAIKSAEAKKREALFEA